MKENNHQIKRHLFICTRCKNQSEPNNETLATEIRKELKSTLKSEFSKTELRVNAAGCLGVCEEGIHGVIYPEGKWFKNIEKSSIPQIIDYVKSTR